MNTHTFELRALRVSDTLAAMTQPLMSIANIFSAPAPTTAASASELLRLADEYEATQSSYAADLRAAAESALRK
jgi:hypothetical protein